MVIARPSSNDSLALQCSSVLSRCAIISVVRPCINSSIASMMSDSVVASTELVG